MFKEIMRYVFFFTFISKAIPNKWNNARINEILGKISLSRWFFEIISGLPSELPIYVLLFEFDAGRFEGMSLFLSFA